MASILRDRILGSSKRHSLGSSKKARRVPETHAAPPIARAPGRRLALPIRRSGFEPHGLRAPRDRVRDPCLDVLEHLDEAVDLHPAVGEGHCSLVGAILPWVGAGVAWGRKAGSVEIVEEKKKRNRGLF
jgi:hypothetical protein